MVQTYRADSGGLVGLVRWLIQVRLNVFDHCYYDETILFITFPCVHLKFSITPETIDLVSSIRLSKIHLPYYISHSDIPDTLL